ncbi:hypothetical protein AZI85_07630 [Bdellovibrio bacteriovorus]|uniref:VWFA domain-containing protein n=1 Tax=Bdellovibrio bacteriovorus TaxID=959 RepID=A0A150WGE4_BDEBC|nr:hypothetical protein [Bdellovibrio bacteriovorus]KYG62062.1 hypothetical protein AZI85_07630 [Bdellovibrio bacteriovorus]
MKKGLSALLVGVSAMMLMACAQDVKFDLPADSDNFDQNVTYNNKVDILWIVDNSSSMLKHQQSLSSQVPDLVTKLNSLKMDYHMAVVTTSVGGTNPDGGKFIGSPKFVTKSTPDLVNSLKSRMIVGEAGSSNERGLQSMEIALSPSYLANEGRGFFREDALLVVIALSNENDKSPVSNPVAYYTNVLDSLKRPWVDGSRSWVFNFIGVLPTSINCSTFNDYSESGLTFIDIAKASGGVTESICSSSLTTAVTNIRSRIYQILTDFKLSKKPLIETITVKINGVSIPRSNVNGWDYIESINAVRFYGSAVPAADASIKVDFKPKEAN